MRSFKRIALLLSIIITVGIFAGCTSGKKSSEQAKPTQNEKISIILGTNAEFPPFEFMNDKGEVDGFDIALMKAVAQEINADIKIENMEFKSLIGSIETGKINLIAAGMTITDERKQSVDFSTPYYEATQKIILRKDDTAIKTKEDLVGKKIAVQEGTTGDVYVTDKIKDSKVSRFKKGVDAVMDLINKRVDAVVIDKSPAEEYVKANKDAVYSIDSNFDIEEYGIAVKKGDTKLLNAVNDGIKKLKENGTYDKLLKEYFK